MSFSNEVKDELARVYPERDCCRRSELGALVRAAGTLRIGSGRRLNVVVGSEHPAIARKTFKLLKDAAGVRPEFIVVRQSRLKKATRFVVRLDHGDARTLLDQMGFAEGGRLNYGIPPSIAVRPCCVRSYLRGFFLGRGSVLSPATGNHLEMSTKHEEQALDIKELLKSLGINAGVISRKADSVVYVKEGEQMARLLNLLGAHACLLKYEDVRVMKDVKNRVNRLVNMETANIDKIAEAGLRQVGDITSIRASFGLERLPQSLRRVAEARLEHPEASLEELGSLMDPPLTKSAVNHRLRRIHKIARSLEQQRPRDRREHDQEDGVDLALDEEGERDDEYRQ